MSRPTTEEIGKGTSKTTHTLWESAEKRNSVRYTNMEWLRARIPCPCCAEDRCEPFPTFAARAFRQLVQSCNFREAQSAEKFQVNDLCELRVGLLQSIHRVTDEREFFSF